MRDRGTLLVVLVAAIGLCAIRMKADPAPALPDQKGNPLPVAYNADMCESDKHWHYIVWTPPVVFLGITLAPGSKNQFYDQDSGKSCCNVGEVVVNPTGKFRAHDEGDVCTSMDQNGATQPGADTMDPPAPLPVVRPFALPMLSLGPTAPTFTPHCNSPTDPTAFHVLHLLNMVTRIDLCTLDTIAAINVTSNPLQVALTPDGKFAIVTSYDNAISFIDTSTNTVSSVIQTDSDTFPAGLAISPDGSFALVTNYNTTPSLLMIDLQKKAISRTFPLPLSYPQSVFLNPDGTLAWVTYPFVNFVEIIDVMTGNVNSSIQVPEPIDVIFNATGTTAYISSRLPGSVFVVDTKTYSTIANIPTAAGSSDLLLPPDGGILTVGNFDGASITAIDPTTLKVFTTIPASSPVIGGALVPIQ
jgi:YVTN family beta-propeller protein